MANKIMKDSGIDWIGNIPQNWDISKVGYILKRSNKLYVNGTTVLSLYREYGVIPKDSRDDNYNVTSEDLSKYRYVNIGDLVVNKMKAWQGSLAVSNYNGVVSPAYFVYNFYKNNVYVNYIHYLLRSTYKDEFKRLSGGIRVGQWDLPANLFEKVPIILPPLKEQKLISDYLDNKCSEIDKLKEDITKQINILKEYKQSVITEAVTKGLNPNVPMKDSGIDWIGEIPEKWNIHRLNCYFSERKNINISEQEQNLLSLSYGNIIKKDINSNKGLLPENYSNYNIVEAGDIVFRLTDLQNDKKSLRSGLVFERGIITSAYITLIPNNEIYSVYYYYLFRCYDIKKVFYNMGNGVRQSLNYSELTKLLIIQPPLSEQKIIANYLDNKCAEIDKIISSKEEQLNTLDEYKKSLIYEYVTGKKEVPQKD